MENKNVVSTPQEEGGIVEKQEAVLTPEQRIVIVGCLNPDMIKTINTEAKNRGIEVVALSDKVVFDYLQVKGVVAPSTAVTLDRFLGDESNRLVAEQQATKLWSILTGNTDVENSENITFTETQVVRNTSLTHKTANELFALLRAFGLFEWKNIKKREFILRFNKSYVHASIQNDIVNMAGALSNDILRFKHSLEADSTLTTEEREKKMEVAKNAVLTALGF